MALFGLAHEVFKRDDDRDMIFYTETRERRLPIVTGYT